MPREAQWSGTPSIKGSSEPLRMFLLTISGIGFAITWGFETTYGTPYLLQLGLSKSRTSAVWIAGPLSGIVMQPLVGVFADSSTARWGRRRPYMLGGAAVVALCLGVLGWAAELVGLLVRDDDDARSFWTVLVAVGAIYALDFSINVVMAASRSLVVDTLPVSKQQLGSAWAARMGAVGHLIGFAIGTIDLRSIWGDWLGGSQFKQLCIISATVLLGTIGLTAWAVTERVLLSPSGESKSQGTLQLVTKLFTTALHLPDRIQAICWAQFWSWIAWFYFLFYSSTWVGETYFRYTNPDALKSSNDRLGDIGRVGSLSLVIFSIITFAGSVLLPFVIASPENAKRPFTPRPPPTLAAILTFVDKHTPDLRIAWLLGHLLFAVALLCAPLVRSATLATAVVAAAGVPWALAQWAPYAFVGVEINRMSGQQAATLANGSSYRRVSTTERDGDAPPSPDALRLEHDGLLGREDSLEGAPSTGEMAGIYLGILNLYTSGPQLLGTFIGMIVFAIVEPGKSRELAGEPEDGGAGALKAGVNAIAVCMFIGGLASLGAAYATWRLTFVR